MIQDKLLIWKFKRGSTDALARIYEKYGSYLLTLATALLNDANTAEDIVHDFFVAFAQSAEEIKLDGSLKAFLATCVANRARDKIRAGKRQPTALDEANSICSKASGPELSAVCAEELQQLSCAVAELPYEQREVIIMHLKGGMKFRQIAKLQDISVNTVQSRYRYGLDKLRSLLNSEMKK
ncbi:MAG: RNA polymerase sigma factor [Planctomycetota bacterium]|jgi:RNA polymerase sigma-70 factor (ECF subfamily)